MLTFLIWYFIGFFVCLIIILVFNRVPKVQATEYTIEFDLIWPFLILSWLSFFFLLLRIFYFLMEVYFPKQLNKLKDFVEGN